eukprot:TRINITY_DN32924_c0_g1_i1.p1 TRINITY_DN32924_c0_g1~~TRINITY_DN32924_c0_g1_i1.p1  ORF type:complete len:397 (+),score=56.65 TRINITY_DN32924_c0_g1_i1:154-1344(+)
MRELCWYATAAWIAVVPAVSLNTSVSIAVTATGVDHDDSMIGAPFAMPHGYTEIKPKGRSTHFWGLLPIHAFQAARAGPTTAEMAAALRAENDIDETAWARAMLKNSGDELHMSFDTHADTERNSLMDVSASESVLEKNRHNDKVADSSSAKVVSSWLSLTFIGAPGGMLKKKDFPWLVRGIQNALASQLELCGAAVRVVDVARISHGVIEDPMSHKTSGMTNFGLVEKLSQYTGLMRRAAHKHALSVQKDSNYTRMKAFYEVRVFAAMRASSEEVTKKINRLQIYSQFADLSHQLALSLGRRPKSTGTESILLDDVGYADVHPRTSSRADLLASELADCTEEGLLQDARDMHQYVMGVACILVILITCAGSAVFALKQPSMVPGRTNPLMPESRT